MATSNVFTKLSMQNGTDEYVAGWLKLFLSLPVVLPFLFIFNTAQPDPAFFKTIAIMLPFEIVAYILFLKALKVSPLSVSLPFLTLTPVFSIFVAFLILGETLTIIGVLGIICVASGAYVLNVDTVKAKGLLEPFKQAFKEKGSKLIMMVAFIYSFTSTMGKLAILQSSVSYFAGVYFVILALVWIPLISARIFYLSKAKRSAVFKNISTIKNYRMFLPMGIIFGLGIIFHCLAIAQVNAAYMIALKRSGVIFSVLYGGLIFKEKKIRMRLAGTCLMVTGVVLVALA